MMMAHFQSGPLPHLVAPTTPTTASNMEMPGYGYGMMDTQLQQNYRNNNINSNQFIQQQYVAPQPAPCSRKRKADSHPENERLAKRMSLLNLEHGGHKLYVPVENPQAANSFSPSFIPSATSTPSSSSQTIGQDDTEYMQCDNTKHKVYIYNIEDELASDSEAEPDGGKLVFLPDIEKHLRQNRIPTQALLNTQSSFVDPDILNKQLVLYSVPASITVPEEQDSVRKAILEARARVREKHLMESQQLQQQQMQQQLQQVNNGLTDTMQSVHPGSLPQFGGASAGDEDDDAMDLDYS
ncbi:hypothetical protein B0H65DRAFT_7501 [Neurospora tetraspora]|uniref:Uncharacterized protein n=1 Tax=Neurospora tetraspora TaxID=94610 RepID=A0AAE0MVB9_9PEZI|nr:hypothetical protein B0H65DRAFT_7501 [Neurospora tetraspora]